MFIRKVAQTTGIVIAFCGLLGACDPVSQSDTAPSGDEAVLVRVAVPKPAQSIRELVVTGRVRAKSEVALSFVAPGRVASIPVQEGDTVARGTLLARLDPAQISASAAAAQAELDRAEAEYTRQKFLFDGGWVAAPRIENAHAAVKAARARVQAAQFDVRQSRLIAPTDGVVLIRHAERNQIVAPAQPVITFAESASGFVLAAQLSDRDFAGITLGTPAMVTIKSLGAEPVEGQVSEIGALADPDTGTFTIEIWLPDMRNLHSGLFGDARILLATESPDEPLVQLPPLAVFDIRASQGLVFVADSGKARLRTVRIERLDRGGGLVVAGLQPEDRVIVSDVDRLQPDMSVRIANGL